MSNISQFFKGDTRKKNRKIFAGNQTVIWTAPSQTSEVDVHVWGGGGNGSTSASAKFAGGGGGYTSNTFVVGAGTTIGVSVGATAGTSTATITNPIGVSTLTSTGGVPGYDPTPSPTFGYGGSGSYTLHPEEPTAYIFTANGGYSRKTNPETPLQKNNAGGGGAGFIYGPGGNGGQVPSGVPGTYNNTNTPSAAEAGMGGGGIKGHGGWVSRTSSPPDTGEIGAGGGGFMPAYGMAQNPNPSTYDLVNYGGAGIDGRFMGSTIDSDLSASGETCGWFYLEDINGMGGSAGRNQRWAGGSSAPFPSTGSYFAANGLAGGGGGGSPRYHVFQNNNGGPGKGGDGGIFGGGGGGSWNTNASRAGNGGYGGGGGGAGGTENPNPAIAGAGGEGIIIIYY